MFRSVWGKLGVNLKRTHGIINGESSSSSSTSPAKYFLFTETRVTSIFSSFYATTATASNNELTPSDSSSSFVVSYLFNSCGLSESEAITASKKINFKTTTKPDSVLTLLKAYGFTEPDISKLINSYPSILSSDPHKTLKPKFDFFRSKGFFGPDIANFFSIDPTILTYSFSKVIIPSFDILKSIVQSDQNVIKLIKRNSWILSTNQVKRVMVNIELLRNQGVPETNISRYLINQPRTFTGDADSFKEIVDKVQDMGFNPLQTAFLEGIIGLASMSEANWKNKMDVYKRLGWSEDQILSAFKKCPGCMTASEKKIMAVMNFLVYEMGYESLSIAECPLIIKCSLKERIIPRCSVIRILVSRGLIKEKIPINTISTMVDESFLEKFVKKYEQKVPELMKIFQGQLNYQQLLQK